VGLTAFCKYAGSRSSVIAKLKAVTEKAYIQKPSSHRKRVSAIIFLGQTYIDCTAPGLLLKVPYR
jgi:hypothetical protein